MAPIHKHAEISAVRNDNGTLSLANYDFVVSSIVSTDVYAFDSRRVIMPIDDLRPILNRTALATKVSVRLRNSDDQNGVMNAIRHKLGSDYITTTWQSMNIVLFTALSQEKLAMTIVISIVTIIALLNILSSMVMIVRYKFREMRYLELWECQNNQSQRFLSVSVPLLDLRDRLLAWA